MNTSSVDTSRGTRSIKLPRFVIESGYLGPDAGWLYVHLVALADADGHLLWDEEAIGWAVQMGYPRLDGARAHLVRLGLIDLDHSGDGHPPAEVVTIARYSAVRRRWDDAA